MCGGNIGDELKKPLYKIVKQDSRNTAWLGNALGWQGLEDEANKNVANPGRAVGKAAASAAAWYLGALAGAGGADAGAAADTGGAAADAAIPMTGMFANAGGAGINSLTQQQLADMAIQAANQQAPASSSLLGNTAGLMKSSLLDPAPGVTLPGHGIGAAVDSALINNGGGQAASYLNSLLGRSGVMGGSAGSKGTQLGLMGLQMMQPHTPPPQGMPQRAGGQQDQGPLPLPYGSPAGNSLGTDMPLSEEQKRRLRAMGYRV